MLFAQWIPHKERERSWKLSIKSWKLASSDKCWNFVAAALEQNDLAGDDGSCVFLAFSGESWHRSKMFWQEPGIGSERWTFQQQIAVLRQLRTGLEIITENFHIFKISHHNRFCCQQDFRSCKTVPGLTRTQLDLCYRLSDVTLAAVEGLELAVQECQYQVMIDWVN